MFYSNIVIYVEQYLKDLITDSILYDRVPKEESIFERN